MARTPVRVPLLSVTLNGLLYLEEKVRGNPKQILVISEVEVMQTNGWSPSMKKEEPTFYFEITWN